MAKEAVDRFQHFICGALTSADTLDLVTRDLDRIQRATLILRLVQFSQKKPSHCIYATQL